MGKREGVRGPLVSSTPSPEFSTGITTVCVVMESYETHHRGWVVGRAGGARRGRDEGGWKGGISTSFDCLGFDCFDGLSSTKKEGEDE